MQKPRKPLKLVGHYMIIEGKELEIDPLKTDLPDRCKLIWAELVTGCKCEIVPNVKSGS
jgi:hypothetical protein